MHAVREAEPGTGVAPGAEGVKGNRGRTAILPSRGCKMCLES